MKPHLIIVLLVAIAVGVGLGQLVKRPRQAEPMEPVAEAVPVQRPAAAEAPAEETTLSEVPLRDDAPSFGPRYAKVTIVQWSDFECPYCARASTTVREIREAYPEDVRFEFRHQPLPTHARAIPAAIAALAADEQGRFWEYHDLLFQQQQALSDDDLEAYARMVGLDLPRFRRSLRDPRHEARIREDAAEGRRLGALGTPTFFINGRKLMGTRSIEDFRLLIDAEIARADSLLARGTPREKLYRALLDAPPAPPTIDDAPSLGPEDAPVTIIEWSDFECPFCARGAERLREIRARYGDQVRIVYKHRPLPIHPQAQLAAEASLAAHAQGRFWPFHDLLFSHQQELNRALMERFAEQLGLDLVAFRAALDEGTYAARVRRDASEALAHGARSTPTFLINGRRVRGAQPLATFVQVIDQELARAAKHQAPNAATAPAP
ncbi:MAG TPA: thioredoxin domain-containing protein [Myxococcaceae bacterium]|nr:thioredoxin domain-containing protein [Myxococcaceae bacterium]